MWLAPLRSGQNDWWSGNALIRIGEGGRARDIIHVGGGGKRKSFWNYEVLESDGTDTKLQTRAWVIAIKESFCHIQQTSSPQGPRWAPGCVKYGEKVVFCLPCAGRRTQLIHLIFTQPGVRILEHPCTSSN